MMKQLEQNLLYHYVLKLKAHWTELKDNNHHNVKFKHLNLLIKYMHTVYILITSYLISFLKNCKIIYDLLWALFKLNIIVYIIILNVKKLTCYRYDFSKKRTPSSRVTYFYVKCHYLNFNRKAFNEVLTAFRIWIFQDAKQINRFKTFFFAFHWC